jgi:DNA-binding response OmpR family regulator
MFDFQHHKCNVLVIDDDTEVRGLLFDGLAFAGYGCRTVADGRSAIEAINKQMPDVIICDIALANESGFEFSQSLKADDRLAEIPVIFISGAQLPNAIDHAHAAGGSYYLRKPFDMSVLLELVDKSLWMPHLVRRHFDDAQEVLSSHRRPRVGVAFHGPSSAHEAGSRD